MTRVIFLPLFLIIFSISSFNIEWLRIKFHNFFNLFFMRLFQSYNSNSGFSRLTWVNSIYFLKFFLIDFFFQFQPPTIQSLFIYLFLLFYILILNYLKIKFYNFFFDLLCEGYISLQCNALPCNSYTAKCDLFVLSKILV